MHLLCKQVQLFKALWKYRLLHSGEVSPESNGYSRRTVVELRQWFITKATCSPQWNRAPWSTYGVCIEANLNMQFEVHWQVLLINKEKNNRKQRWALLCFKSSWKTRWNVCIFYLFLYQCLFFDVPFDWLLQPVGLAKRRFILWIKYDQNVSACRHCGGSNNWDRKWLWYDLTHKFSTHENLVTEAQTRKIISESYFPDRPSRQNKTSWSSQQCDQSQTKNKGFCWLCFYLLYLPRFFTLWEEERKHCMAWLLRLALLKTHAVIWMAAVESVSTCSETTLDSRCLTPCSHLWQ